MKFSGKMYFKILKVTKYQGFTLSLEYINLTPSSILGLINPTFLAIKSLVILRILILTFFVDTYTRDLED